MAGYIDVIAPGPTVSFPDLFPRWFCHINDTSKPNPWYPTGVGP
jgi:hypothetical protein